LIRLVRVSARGRRTSPPPGSSLQRVTGDAKRQQQGVNGKKGNQRGLFRSVLPSTALPLRVAALTWPAEDRQAGSSQGEMPVRIARGGVLVRLFVRNSAGNPPLREFCHAVGQALCAASQ